VARAASSCNAFAIATFSSYQYTALSSCAVDGHQMYFGDSIVGKASTTGIDILLITFLIFTSCQKGKFGVVFNISRESLNFELPAFENAAIYPNSEAHFLCSRDRSMFSPSLVKLGPRPSENLSVKVTHPLKFNGYLALDSLLWGFGLD